MSITDHNEWIRQAEDDLKSAGVLLAGGRYTHCVFFCHLAIEKSLKAVYSRKFGEEPPKTHNLSLLMNETEVKPPEDMRKLIDRLAAASVPTRYPEDLRRMAGKYNKTTTPEILKKSEEVRKWIKDLLKK